MFVFRSVETPFCRRSHTTQSNNSQVNVVQHMQHAVQLEVHPNGREAVLRNSIKKIWVYRSSKARINGENLSVVAWFEQKILINPSKCSVLDKSMGKTSYGHALPVLLKENNFVTMIKVHYKYRGPKISSKNKNIKKNSSLPFASFAPCPCLSRLYINNPGSFAIVSGNTHC